MFQKPRLKQCGKRNNRRDSGVFGAESKEIAMLMSSSIENDLNRDVEKRIRRERILWLGGVTFPVALLIALFVL